MRHPGSKFNLQIGTQVMRYSPPSTVDIPAEPSANASSPQQITVASVIWQSLMVDIVLLGISLLMGLLFNSAVGVVEGTNDLGSLMLRPAPWFIYLVCAIGPLVYLLVDAVTALSNPAALPFARSSVSLKAIYAKRIHLLLLAFYFTSILVALCWSAPSMLLTSKLFVSAVFGIALYALGQSIPSQRLSFLVSGILFMVVLITTQVFIVTRVQADANKAGQEALDELSNPDGEVEDQGILFDDSEP